MAFLKGKFLEWLIYCYYRTVKKTGIAFFFLMCTYVQEEGFTPAWPLVLFIAVIFSITLMLVAAVLPTALQLLSLLLQLPAVNWGGRLLTFLRSLSINVVQNQRKHLEKVTWDCSQE